ncbi:MAG: hypothetical protein KDA52_16270, partial [Planctomycetaceae bacterium]|nr:hypothetical protein [Planctomycetaceae bacterium]
MSNKPGRGGVGPNRTRDQRTSLTDGIKSMFSWIGPKAARMTVYEVLLQHYIQFTNVRPQTAKRYKCEVRRWERLAGSPKLFEINADHFLRFREAALAEDLKPSSLEGSLKIVKAVLRFAKDSGWIDSLPRWGKPLTIETPPADPATLDEIEALYRIADNAFRPARGSVSPADWWRAFLCLELWTGLRVSDAIMRFSWENVEADKIMFRASKTGRMHIFPRCPIVDAHLKLVADWDPDLVVGNPGPRMVTTVRDEMKWLCGQAGIRELTPKALREACVTNWLIAGESAGRIIHGTGLTIAERHYAGRLQILTEASQRFQ